MKVLEIKTKQSTYEIHTLNPGEVFHGFGGSRHALVAKKTASIIVRERSVMGLYDREANIHSPEIWRWMETLINLKGEHGVQATYFEPPVQDTEEKKTKSVK